MALAKSAESAKVAVAVRRLEVEVVVEVMLRARPRDNRSSGCCAQWNKRVKLFLDPILCLVGTSAFSCLKGLIGQAAWRFQGWKIRSVWTWGAASWELREELPGRAISCKSAKRRYLETFSIYSWKGIFEDLFGRYKVCFSPYEIECISANKLPVSPGKRHLLGSSRILPKVETEISLDSQNSVDLSRRFSLVRVQIDF